MSNLSPIASSAGGVNGLRKYQRRTTHHFFKIVLVLPSTCCTNTSITSWNVHKTIKLTPVSEEFPSFRFFALSVNNTTHDARRLSKCDWEMIDQSAGRDDSTAQQLSETVTLQLCTPHRVRSLIITINLVLDVHRPHHLPGKSRL